MTMLRPQSAVVVIRYVDESRTKATWQRPEGRRRFVIGAERMTGDRLGERALSFTTLDPWKASLCQQARDKGFRLAVKYRDTGYFDFDLLHVEIAKGDTNGTLDCA